MSLQEASTSYKNSGAVGIRTIYPDFPSVAIELYPTAKLERPTIDKYEESLKLRGKMTPAVSEALQKARKLRESTRAMVYIAGGLTGVDEKTKERYGKASELLESYGTIIGSNGKEHRLVFGYVPHLHGTDPVKHPQVTGEEVRAIDHLFAGVTADLHLNFLHPMAHGNAIEEGWSEDHMIPTVFFNPQGNKLSRLTVGMDNIADTITYKDVETDGMNGLRGFMDEYSAWLRKYPDRDPREYFYLAPRNLREAALQKNGIEPNGFKPVFAIGQYDAYVRDPQHPRHGQVGSLTAHDWRESGDYFVEFSDGKSERFFDGMMDGRRQQCGLSFWLK